MEWDLGLQGLGVLLAMSLLFGIVAQVLGARGATRWVGVIGGATFFVSGLVISEVWFGWATQGELQPNIDGLSFDEVLLALVPGIAAALLTRYVAGRRGGEPMAAESARRTEGDALTPEKESASAGER